MDEILTKVTPASHTFPLADALGSTIAVTDASGTGLERIYYSDAFGTPTFKDAAGTTLAGSSTTGTRFLFTGRGWLATLGLYDYRNRTYSAELGRFVQTDPIGFKAGDINLYRYVLNSPLRWIDPLGLYMGPGSTDPELEKLVDETRPMSPEELEEEKKKDQEMVDAYSDVMKDLIAGPFKAGRWVLVRLKEGLKWAWKKYDSGEGFPEDRNK